MPRVINNMKETTMTPPNTSNPDTSKQKPVQKVHSGSVTGAIWENAGKEGPFYSATFERTYKDGEEYKNATSYGASELPHLAMAATKAALAIDGLIAEARRKGSR